MGMDVIGNSGTYFWASIFEWRAICLTIELSGHELPESWRGNGGHGLSWQEECDFLADHIGQFLMSLHEHKIYDDTQRIFVDEYGWFVDPGTPNSEPAYSVTREKLGAFIEFLKTCDGFAIY